MTQRGIDKRAKFIIGWLCLWVVFASCSTTSSLQEIESSRFQEARHILVETAFFEQNKYDMSVVNQSILSSLQQIGKEQTHLDRQTLERTDGLLSIMVTPVVESGTAKGYPILQLSMKLSVPACFPNKSAVMVSGRLWEAEEFIGIEEGGVTEKLDESIEQMLRELGALYEKAQITPVFVVGYI